MRPLLPRPDRRWVAPVLYLALAIAFAAHLVADPAHRTVAVNARDQTLISAFLHAQPWLLLHGHNPLLITTFNVPDGVNAMWNGGLLLPSMVMAPVTLTLGATVTFNLLLVLGLAGSAWTMSLLVGRWTRRVPAVLAGLVYGFSPAMLNQANGHLHLVFAVLVPLLFGALFDVVTLPYSHGRSLRLGLLAAAQLLTGEELLACWVITGALLLAILVASRPRSVTLAAVKGLVAAGGVFAVVAGYPLWFQLRGPRQQYGSPFTADYYKADLTSYVTPMRTMLFHTAANLRVVAHFRGGLTEQDAFLGWPLLIFALVVLVVRFRDVRVRAAGLTAVLLSVFALGAKLMVDGVQRHVELPWLHLARLPLLSTLLPNRFGLFVAGLVGFVLAVGLDGLLSWADRQPRPWPVRAGAGVLAVLVLLPLLPHQLLTAASPPPPTLISSGLSRSVLPPGSVVLAVPFPAFQDPVAMDWQRQDRLRWSMPGGYFLGPLCPGRRCRGRASLDADQRPTARLLLSAGRGGRTAATITPYDRANAAADLRYWGVTRVLVGPGPRQADLVGVVAALLGRPGTARADSWVWTVP